MKLPSHDHFGYSPISRRRNYQWPEAKRLAVYVALNLEHFSFGQGGTQCVPQLATRCAELRLARLRVGAGRLLEIFEHLALPASLLGNTSLYDYCPELITAFRGRGRRNHYSRGH